MQERELIRVARDCCQPLVRRTPCEMHGLTDCGIHPLSGVRAYQLCSPVERSPPAIAECGNADRSLRLLHGVNGRPCGFGPSISQLCPGPCEPGCQSHIGAGYRLLAPLHTNRSTPAALMKFDDQKRQPGIEALAGAIRLNARLLACEYRT